MVTKANGKAKQFAAMLSPPTESRPQNIFTPKPIVDFVEKVFRGRIRLDPCWEEGCLTNPAQGAYTESDDGLSKRWVADTFVNPPFKDLKQWILKAMDESLSDEGKTIYGKTIIMLCPVRTHRRWFRQGLSLAARVAWLPPVKFIGYEAGFPAPMCLIMWGASNADKAEWDKHCADLEKI